MGFTLVFDQDAPYFCAAETLPLQNGDYDSEDFRLGYNIADFYKFSLTYYNKPTLLRMIVWSAYAFWNGFVCCFVPLYAYGLGMADASGRTEDLWAVGFVSVLINIWVHHF